MWSSLIRQKMGSAQISLLQLEGAGLGCPNEDRRNAPANSDRHNRSLFQAAETPSLYHYDRQT